MKRSAPEHGRAKQRLLFRVCGSDGFQDREGRTGERGISMARREDTSRSGKKSGKCSGTAKSTPIPRIFFWMTWIDAIRRKIRRKRTSTRLT